MAKRLVMALIVALAAVVVLGGAAGLTDHGCWIDAFGNQHCHFDGSIPEPLPPPAHPGTEPPERPPIRYLVLDTDYTGTECYWWSRVDVAGAIDTWDPANDPSTILSLLNRPPCAVAPAVIDPATRAWEVYRSWTLALPSPQFSPTAPGVVGLPTYIAATATPLRHIETLPSGIDLVVTADVSSVTVNWGDGTTGVYSLGEATGYPAGAATHTYTTKGPYTVTATFTWTAGYSYDSGWVALESVALSSRVEYPVEEIVAVPSE